MIATQVEEFLHQLRHGRCEPAEIAALDRAAARELLEELASIYTYRFQERRLHDKWEISMAKSLRQRLDARFPRQSVFPILIPTPVFRSCVFVSGEGDRITGLGVTKGLIARPTRRSPQELVVTTGSGFKLDRTPDGWVIQTLKRRTVHLSQEFLRKRGWRFDSFWPLAGSRS